VRFVRCPRAFDGVIEQLGDMFASIGIRHSGDTVLAGLSGSSRWLCAGLLELDPNARASEEMISDRLLIVRCEAADRRSKSLSG
jgi:hypothetical protein